MTGVVYFGGINYASMRTFLFLVAILLVSRGGTQSPESFQDALEVRYVQDRRPDLNRQSELRDQPAWQGFINQHGTWYVHFNEANGLPHRAYGKPIPVSGNSSSERAMAFLEGQLAAFGVPTSDLVPFSAQPSGKYDWVNFRQLYQGLQVIDSRVTVKMLNNQVVLFGLDYYPIQDFSVVPALPSSAAEPAASAGVEGIEWIDNPGELCILPVPSANAFTPRLVYALTVHARSTTGIPSAWRCLVDAQSGQLLSRYNEVKHHGGDCRHPAMCPPVNTTATIVGNIHEENPWIPAVNAPLPNIEVSISGTTFNADEDGVLDVTANPGTSATVRLMGPWSRIYTNGTTPQQTVTLENGTMVFGGGNIRERSAYASVQRIHKHLKTWLPAFDDMDFQIPTNIDVAGECNAFYDGESINFYNIGGGCNATSLVHDVVYHEYAHGINDVYYQSIGGAFINGAMNEGYADFWAISLTDNPVLAIGFYTDNEEGIRIYNEEPKVYPIDLLGQVHNDGEIIMGAWWRSHQLMGANWPLTMSLFLEAYNGLQAMNTNGNEGVAYTDVLIDALQADDDDGDITNGTPNGNAIVEGFYIHGITLLSNATLSHTAQQFVPAEQELELNATLTLQFPFTQYLQNVECAYRINNGAWQMVPMTNSGGNNYMTAIDGQEPSTVIGYYLLTRDVNDFVSNVTPRGAQLDPFPALPHFVLSGVEVVGVHDCDNNEDWGAWQTGVFGDNATTGQWTNDVPIGSQTTDAAPGTIVQTFTQVTPDGEYCFVTGNAPNESEGIGVADVDAGRTTLQSSIIDMSSYDEPVVAYWRWYTNSPPGGANPGADYWQVFMSNNGGSTWTEIEDTKTSDMRWRRNAFRVSDYLEPTAQMRFRFIASDSIRPLENLQGGSLIEAALDDFILYDATTVSVAELEDAQIHLVAWPNPLSTGNREIELSFAMSVQGNTELRIYSQTGQLVHSAGLGHLPSGVVRRRITLPELAAGAYMLEVRGTDVKTTRLIVGR